MKTADLHDELCQALLIAGAVEPETIVPAGYNGKKVDAVFKSERILIEVKSLVKDQADAKLLSARLEPIIGKWMGKGGPVVFGTVPIPWQQMPERMRHEVEAAIAPRLEKNLKDANKQFRETKAALGWAESFNVLPFILPNTFATHPGGAAWNLLHRRAGLLPEIDATMAITVQVLDQSGSVDRPMECFYFPVVNAPAPHGINVIILRAWVQHFSAKTGVKVIERTPSDGHFFNRYLSTETGAET